jgi:hypothetical protein
VDGGILTHDRLLVHADDVHTVHLFMSEMQGHLCCMKMHFETKRPRPGARVP